LGRVIGESAALIFTAGTVAEVAKSLTSSGRTLAVHMYLISGEGIYVNQTYATAVILLILVIVMNLLSEWIANKLGRNKHE
jgi:phosphate transport system permease protein